MLTLQLQALRCLLGEDSSSDVVRLDDVVFRYEGAADMSRRIEDLSRRVPREEGPTARQASSSATAAGVAALAESSSSTAEDEVWAAISRLLGCVAGSMSLARGDGGIEREALGYKYNGLLLARALMSQFS